MTRTWTSFSLRAQHKAEFDRLHATWLARRANAHVSRDRWVFALQAARAFAKQLGPKERKVPVDESRYTSIGVPPDALAELHRLREIAAKRGFGQADHLGAFVVACARRFVGRRKTR